MDININFDLIVDRYRLKGLVSSIRFNNYVTHTMVLIIFCYHPLMLLSYLASYLPIIISYYWWSANLVHKNAASQGWMIPHTLSLYLSCSFPLLCMWEYGLINSKHPPYNSYLTYYSVHLSFTHNAGLESLHSLPYASWLLSM